MFLKVKKIRRIMFAIGVTALVIAIGAGAKMQSFTEPLSILFPVIVAGEILAVVAYFSLRNEDTIILTHFGWRPPYQYFRL